jgi:hypothetical protein
MSLRAALEAVEDAGEQLENASEKLDSPGREFCATRERRTCRVRGDRQGLRAEFRCNGAKMGPMSHMVQLEAKARRPGGGSIS